MALVARAWELGSARAVVDRLGSLAVIPPTRPLLRVILTPDAIEVPDSFLSPDLYKTFLREGIAELRRLVRFRPRSWPL